MIRLFFLNLIFVFLSVNVIADPFTQEIGIIKEVITEPIIEEIKEFEKVVEVIEDETEVIEEEIIIEKVAVEKVKDIFVEDKKVVSSKIINLNPLTAYSLKEYVLKGIATRKAKQRDTKFKRIKVSNYDYGKTPTIHTVKKNEDLNTIAFRYGFSVNELKIANAIVPGTDKLISGNKLVIPNRFHRVKENETVESIAKKYDLAPIQLAAYNELENDEYLIINQKLLLPFFIHVTRKVEYLKNIAKLYDREIEELLKINNLEFNNYILVKENQFIKIPIHVNKNYNYDNFDKKSINDYSIDIRNLGIIEIKGSQFMIREGDRIGNKDGIVVSILNQKMLVLQESMEYEYYINAPVAGQTLASLSVNQLINDNQEEIDPVNDDVIDDNNQVNNTPTTAINSENALTNIEELFN
jgi:LysM repeat protein